MSFRDWINSINWEGGIIDSQSRRMERAWEAGYAESEAEITALQSERDALRAAVELVNKEILSRIEEDKCPRCGQKKLLPTPASGEPARKP